MKTPKKYYYYKEGTSVWLLDLRTINIMMNNATLYIQQAGHWEELPIPKAQQSVLISMWRELRDNE